VKGGEEEERGRGKGRRVAEGGETETEKMERRGGRLGERRREGEGREGGLKKGGRSRGRGGWRKSVGREKSAEGGGEREDGGPSRNRNPWNCTEGKGRWEGRSLCLAGRWPRDLVIIPREREVPFSKDQACQTRTLRKQDY